jgi:sulfur carrier protein
MTKKITVTQNSMCFELNLGTTVFELLAMQQMEQQAIAIAINQQVIARAQWPQQILQDQDHIAIFQSIAGG